MTRTCVARVPSTAVRIPDHDHDPRHNRGGRRSPR